MLTYQTAEILYMWPLMACHSPHWNNLVFISDTIMKFCHCVTSLALENGGQKYCQTIGYKPNPSIPQLDFQCLALPTIQKYWLLVKQHKKQLQMDRNSKEINPAKRIIACQKKNRAISCNMILKYLPSRTQTPDSKHENRSNSLLARGSKPL